MKKKITSLICTFLILTLLSISAIGTFVPSPGLEPSAQSENEEIEVVTDNIVTGGYILQKGSVESRTLEQISYPVIKITTMQMSIPANEKIDTQYPEASYQEKSGMMTESALSYGKNATVNEVADRYYQADTVGDFIDNYNMSFFDNLVSLAEGKFKNYSVVQIADISANSQATSANKSVRITFTTPGVKMNSRVIVARIKNGSVEFVASSAGDKSIKFDVYPNNLGTYVLMTYAE